MNEQQRVFLEGLKINCEIAYEEMLLDTRLTDDLPKKTDMIKRRLCLKFWEYMNNNGHDRRILAKRLNVEESALIKIFHFKYDEISIDTMLDYLEILSVNDRGIADSLKRISLA